jgi:membrane-bound lytic murein transglycosylase D
MQIGASIRRLLSRQHFIAGLTPWVLVLACTTMFSHKLPAQGYKVTFCGEVIPVSEDFVANKLMDVIRRMVKVVNMPSIRSQALAYFPFIEQQLRAYGLPADFKYLPIIESNFQLLTSKAGAHGFWQLMPATAIQYGLVINDLIDERNDVMKSTAAAAQLLKDYYQFIYKRHKIYSWTLTAAAYNFGNGNIDKAIKSQGANYFGMNLNPETAMYVYKIIAVKELFEHPELYMNNFGYNVFQSAKPKPAAVTIKPEEEKIDTTVFASLTITASQNEPAAAPKEPSIKYLKASISGKYSQYADGDMLYIKLEEDLLCQGSFRKRGNVIKGKSYLIDGRIVADLGFGHYLVLCDSGLEKGLEPEALRNGARVFIKQLEYEDM